MSFKKFGSKIGILDTSISSLNLGDFIIMDSAKNVLNDFKKITCLGYTSSEQYYERATFSSLSKYYTPPSRSSLLIHKSALDALAKVPLD